MTSVADPRWHQIPSPTARITRVENVLMQLSLHITEANAEIATLRERVEQLELEADQLRENVYNA